MLKDINKQTKNALFRSVTTGIPQHALYLFKQLKRHTLFLCQNLIVLMKFKPDKMVTILSTWWKSVEVY